MEKDIFVVQGQPCYVRVTGTSDESISYVVGTLGSPESPVSVRLAGKDSFNLRMKAVEQGLLKIFESNEQCQGEY